MSIANKRYTLVFLDAKDNELMRKEIEAFDLLEAQNFAHEIQSNSMLNDLSKIEIHE
jgi:hypothetical protein